MTHGAAIIATETHWLQPMLVLLLLVIVYATRLPRRHRSMIRVSAVLGSLVLDVMSAPMIVTWQLIA